MGTTVIVPPATEPVSLAEVKAHLRVDTPDDDQLITSLIPAARLRVESLAYVRLITQTLALTLDRFPYSYVTRGVWPFWGGRPYPWPAIELEPPVQSVSSIAYVDPSGNNQTLSAGQYRLDAGAMPPIIAPALGVIWPAVAVEPEAVTVTYVAGFGPASAVPANLLLAMKLLLGHYYNNREQILSGTRLVALEIPEGFDDLVRDYSPPLVA